MYLIHAFAKETNIACAADGKKTTGLLLYIIFNFLTLGIYGIVWSCMWINRCNFYLATNHKPEGLQIHTYLLTILLFGFLTLGIMYIVVYCKMLYLQNKVNATYNENSNNHGAPQIGQNAYAQPYMPNAAGSYVR